MTDGGLSSKDVILKGTAIALIVTIPSLTVFGIYWSLSSDLVQAAIAGGIVHFVLLAFSFKISRKLLYKADRFK